MAGMTKIDLPWARLTRPTLAARRARARLVRLATALCVGLAVFTVLAVMHSMVATTTVVVAMHAITRGSVIGDDDVVTLEVPLSPAVRGAISSTDDAVGSIAQTDLVHNQPLFPTNARDSPVVPDDHTVLEVTVSNDAARLIAGDRVSLVSAVGCSADEGATGESAMGEATDGHTETANESTEDSGADDDARLCTLAHDALVMGRATKAPDGTGNARVSLAMRPGAAMKVMESAELGVIVAVTK